MTVTYLYVREARVGDNKEPGVSHAPHLQRGLSSPTAPRQVMIESTYHMKEMNDFRHTVHLGSKMARLAEHRSLDRRFSTARTNGAMAHARHSFCIRWP